MALLELADLGALTPCQVDPTPFYAEHRAHQAEAAEACGHCPVLIACRRFADLNNECHGVWGRHPQGRGRRGGGLMPEIPAARIVAQYRAPEYFVTVDDPDAGEVRVRWRLYRAEPWRCDACGSMATTDCLHTFAAALLLGEQFFGLTRLPELEPIQEGTTP